MTQTNVVVTIAEFRQRFPLFQDNSKYSDDIVQCMLDTATMYIPTTINCYVKDSVLKQMIYLMTAHLILQYQDLADGNNNSGMMSSATIDKISISKTIPPNKTQLQWWLNSTTYGTQLLSLLKLQSAGGLYIGGSKENVFR